MMDQDDLVCVYDSTWDTESDGDDPGENQTRRSSQDKTKSWTSGLVRCIFFSCVTNYSNVGVNTANEYAKTDVSIRPLLAHVSLLANVSNCSTNGSLTT